VANSIPLNILVLGCITDDYEMKASIYSKTVHLMQHIDEYARSVIYAEILSLVELGYAECYEANYGTACIWRYFRITNKGKRKLAATRKEINAYA
jgi:DNA-binding PadR family transcriptional regulator